MHIKVASIRSRIGGIKMNEVRFRFHLLVIDFIFHIIDLLYEKCNEHIAKAKKILEESERYGR